MNKKMIGVSIHGNHWAFIPPAGAESINSKTFRERKVLSGESVKRIGPFWITDKVVIGQGM